MLRSGLTDLEVVLAVARRQGFRAAAVELEMSTSAVSQAVAGLEARLGARLFHRTTRSVSLTEEGAAFVAEIEPSVTRIREAMGAVRERRGEVAGTLRINTSLGAALMGLQPVLAEFLARHPAMTVEVATEGRRVDIVAEGFDAGVRLAEQVPRDMIRVPLGPPLRMTVVGSPAFFERHATPARPEDLLALPCVRGRLPGGEPSPWMFSRDGRAWPIDVPGPLVLDSPVLMLEAARAGLGLAQLAWGHVERDVGEGRLRPVLDEWMTPGPPLCLYYWGHRHVPAGLRALVALLRERQAQLAEPSQPARRGRRPRA